MADDPYAAWVEWAKRQSFTDERAVAAVAAARAALDAGADQWLAEMAGRAAAGEGVRGAAAARAAGLASAIDEVERLPEPPARVLDALRAKLSVASSLAGAAAAVPAGERKPQTPRPTRPSLRRVAADNSVLVVGVTGAFLLVVATVLFELYGAATYSGVARFGAVAALAAAFGLASRAAYGHDRFRTVGQVYVAVFALLFPLVFAAAYTFLDLDGRGITVAQALFATGLASTVVYAILAHRLGAAAYAWLSVISLPLAWGAGAVALVAGEPSHGALFSALVPVAAVAARGSRASPAWRPFRIPLLLLVNAAALVGAGWSTLAGTCFDGCAGPHSWIAVASWTAIATGYWLLWKLENDGWGLLALPASSAAVVLIARALSDSGAVLVLVLAALACGYVAAMKLVPGNWRWLVLAGALVQVLVSIPPDSPAWSHAMALLVGAAALALASRLRRQPVWAAAAALTLTAAWYWFGTWLLPPPADPSLTYLAWLYVPLPIVLAAAGVGIGRLTGQMWAIALLLPAALAACISVSAALVANDFALAGWSLLVYALVAYLVGAIQRWPYVAGVAVIVAAAGASSLVQSGTAGPAWRLAPLAVMATAAYAAGEGYRRSGLSGGWVLIHRWLGLGGAGLITVGAAVVPAYYQRGSLDDLTAPAAALFMAALLVADAHLHEQPLLDYLAAVAVGLVPGWLAGFAGITDALAYTLAPGAALVAAGAWLPFDRRVLRRAWLDRAAVALGLAVALGPEAFGAAAYSGDVLTHVFRLLAGGVLSVVAAIALHSRVLAVGGAVAIGLSALRALFLVLATVQPYIVFGIVALVLLAGAAALAGLRGRLPASAGQERLWQDWN